jgi:cephalosporin-C deacetylase
MALFDLPLSELRVYRPERDEPADFAAFWAQTLAETNAHPLDATFTPHDTPLTLVDVHDVRFGGWNGERIAAWLIVPSGVHNPVPAIVKYIGYTGGRGWPHDHLEAAAAGYATLVMDTRGHVRAETPDPAGGNNSQAPGMMTRGVLDPNDYYYRRVYADAVRAVEAARSHPLVDSDRIVVAGGSQGGGIAQAVAGLVPGLAGALIDVPFLTGFRRATEIVDTMPYREIVDYLKVQRANEDQVFKTLSYFDGMNFAARATVPALFSVGLMDQTCPPSTVFAAYNHYAGPKDIRVWPYNQHEGGQSQQLLEELYWLRDLFKGSLARP